MQVDFIWEIMTKSKIRGRKGDKNESYDGWKTPISTMNSSIYWHLILKNNDWKSATGKKKSKMGVLTTGNKKKCNDVAKKMSVEKLFAFLTVLFAIYLK